MGTCHPSIATGVAGHSSTRTELVGQPSRGTGGVPKITSDTRAFGVGQYLLHPAYVSEWFIVPHGNGVQDRSPLWFKTLYIVEPLLVVSFFNLTDRRVRFKFEGCGFCESMSSFYEFLILPGGVYYSPCPSTSKGHMTG